MDLLLIHQKYKIAEIGPSPWIGAKLGRPTKIWLAVRDVGQIQKSTFCNWVVNFGRVRDLRDTFRCFGGVASVIKTVLITRSILTKRDMNKFWPKFLTSLWIGAISPPFSMVGAYTSTTGYHEPQNGWLGFGVCERAILFWNSSTTPTEPPFISSIRASVLEN